MQALWKISEPLRSVFCQSLYGFPQAGLPWATRNFQRVLFQLRGDPCKISWCTDLRILLWGCAISFRSISSRDHSGFHPGRLAKSIIPKQNCSHGANVNRKCSICILQNFKWSSFYAVAWSSTQSCFRRNLAKLKRNLYNESNNGKLFAHKITFRRRWTHGKVYRWWNQSNA